MIQVIAEIGCNHGGEVATAVRMIEVLTSYCTEHFDCTVAPPIIKSQKRTPRELLTEAEYNAPHPAPHQAYGATYGAHREALELSIDAHRELQAVARSHGAVYTLSVWDMTAAQEAASLYPPLIKVPSACNLHFEMLAKLAGSYEGEIHLSLGMTTRDEVERIVSFMERLGASKRTVLYACTSGYPVDFTDICLREITRLQRLYGHRVKSIGFSGHHHGIAPDMAAAALGVSHIERHVTLNRAWKGTDHAASLEPDGFRKLMRDLRHVEAAMQPRPETLLPIELPQREKLKRKATDRVVPDTVKMAEVA